jgi:propanol-preferring alcohol dehydrogenase
VRKGGTIVLGVLGNVTDFPTFEEKTIKGSVIGTRKDMAELVRLASDSDLKIVIETFKLEEANEVLAKLKNSQIEARAVLIP